MSDLVGNPEDRFSHNEAHIISGEARSSRCAAINVSFVVLLEPRHEKTCTLTTQHRSAYIRYIGGTIPLLSKSEKLKPLAIFFGCSAPFESDLVEIPDDSFAHEADQLLANCDCADEKNHLSNQYLPTCTIPTCNVNLLELKPFIDHKEQQTQLQISKSYLFYTTHLFFFIYFSVVDLFIS